MGISVSEKVNAGFAAMDITPKHGTHPLHTYWNKLEPDALDKIVDKSLEILNKLYKK